MKQYQKARVRKPENSVFDLSHERKFTTNMADLTPVFIQEVVPGDKFQVNMEALVRFQPLTAPIMHRINVYTHFFFVPYRLIWKQWEEFITGGVDGKNEPIFPVFTGLHEQFAEVFTGQTKGRLADYLGVPIQQYSAVSSNTAPSLSQLPFRAYYLVWQEYYRDPTLQEPEITHDTLVASTQDSILSTSGNIDKLLDIRQRCWEKDYFTSALPWAQRGDQVTIPLLGDAPVHADGPLQLERATLVPPTTPVAMTAAGIFEDSTAAELQYKQGLSTDLTGATSTTINDLRTSYAIQRFLEKNARAGYRYIEQILSRFGVKSSDARLQRPEYLGGGKMPVSISEVLQTSATELGSAQGNMSGHGITGGSITGFSRFFEEHGFVIGIMSVMPRTAYMQGLPKIFSKFDKFDYLTPEFTGIGEQEVKNQELYLDDSLQNENTFGYQERYVEYRTAVDTVHGDLRTNLDHWHMAREFSSMPELNADFVKANPTTRIYPVELPEVNYLIVQTYAKVRAIRPLPKFGDPM